MKTVQLLPGLFVASALFTACSKDQQPSLPKAFFDTRIGNLKPDSSTALEIATYHNFKAHPTTIVNATYHWDYGDGRSSDGEVAGLRYNQPGEYTLTLTVDQMGRKASYAKKIRVSDKIISKFIVTRLNWNSLSNSDLWSAEKKAGVFIRVQTPGSTGYPLDGPVLYESEIKQQVSASDLPLKFNTPTGLVLAEPSFLSYSYALFAKDDNGAERLLLLNWASGTGLNMIENYSARSSAYEYTFRGTLLRIEASY